PWLHYPCRVLSSVNKKAGMSRPSLCAAMVDASTSVVKDRSAILLHRLEVVGRALALAAVHDGVEADLLAFHESAHAGALDRGDVDEHIIPARVGRDEAETLGGVEELNRSDGHDNSFQSGIDERNLPAPCRTVDLSKLKGRSLAPERK